MAKGARAPSHNAYRGSIGRTRSRTLHVTAPNGDLIVATVTSAIDAVADPELVERLRAGTLNVVEVEAGGQLAVGSPVVYHDPAAELLVLVLGDADRHREIDERIRLLEELRADGAHVPAYAKDFAVVFGPAGLAAYLEKRAQDALKHVESHREIERRRAEVERVKGELERARVETAETRAELEAERAELHRVRAQIPPPSVLAPSPQLRRDAPTDQISISQLAIERTRQQMEASGLRDALVEPPVLQVRDHVEVREHDHDEDERPSRVHLREASTHRVELVEPEALAADAPEPDVAEDVELRDDSVARVVSPAPQATAVTAAPAPPAAHATPIPHVPHVPHVPHAAPTTAVATPSLAHVEIDEEHTAQSIVPQGADPLTTETVELPLQPPAADSWLELATTAATSSLTVDNGGARLALLAGDTVARSLGGILDVRILLYRLPTYPIVALVIGPPIAFRGGPTAAGSPSQLAIVPLDVGAQLDRDVLTALAGGFELRVDVIKRGKLLRSVSLVGPLAENAGYVLRAAEDHLRGLAADGSAPSFDRARDAVMAPGFDILGTEHAEAAEFRDDKLAQLETANQLRRAVAMARRFARPAREDYLVCTRGFPISRWHELRRHVVQSAVTWGIWMGPELAQVAVSEGFARSRRDLVVRLDAGFDALRRHPSAFDIDQDAADDNLAALAEEARAMGVELRKSVPQKNGHIASDDVIQVAGSIERTPTSSIPRGKSIEELVLLLDDRNRRVAAALELCERADPRAAAPVIAVVQKLSRAEAVRVLGTSVRFGAAAAPPLLAGLKSSKAFLRHGCALALAMLRTEDGTQAVVELLVEEPTEIWREVARAVGQIGPNALMPLAAHAGRLGDRMTPQLSDRIAWAMAHIAARGGKAALEALANGHSVVAPIARKALDLTETAATDHTIVRAGSNNGDPARDVTVNRAFSRRFFEALDQSASASAGLAGSGIGEMSSPMEMLDEADLIDDEEALDESDLIQP